MTARAQRRTRRNVGLAVLSAAAILALACVRASSPGASPPVALLTFDTATPRAYFAPGAVGLSIETFELSSLHLRGEHRRLVRLMRLLGPSVLRIGGDSVDVSWWTSRGEPPPSWAANTVTPADLSALSGLLAATGWRVLLGVDLGHDEPARIADEARYARMILRRRLLGIEIGNEPDDFARRAMLRPAGYGVAQYRSEAQRYEAVIRSADVAVYGPALARIEWLSPLGGLEHSFSAITLHYYPSATCVSPQSAVGSGLEAGSELLEPAVRQEEDQVLGELARAGALIGRPTRVGETNASACAGSPSTHPLYAEALWSLDLSLRAASEGVNALNFHGSLGVCAAFTESPVCAGSQERARTGALLPQPEYYGLLAARQLEGGRFIPVHLSVGLSSRDLTSWATLAPDGTVKLAIENFAIGGAPHTLLLAEPRYTATAQTLSGVLGDPGAPVSLGGVEVSRHATWHPHPLALTRKHGLIQIALEPASAIILTLQPGTR